MMNSVTSVAPAIRPQAPQALRQGHSSEFARLLTPQGAEGPRVDGVASLGQSLDHAVEGLEQGRRRMDQLIAAARGGKHFQPAELLALQAEVFRSTETAALTQKVVEAGVNGMRRLWSMQL